jgi:hypothetical protein
VVSEHGKAFDGVTMKREGTIGVGALLALAAAVGLSVQSGPKQGNPESFRATSTARRSVAKATELRENLESFLGAPNLLFPTPCEPGSPSPVPTPSDRDLKFVIATLPDPLHTHMAVSFDQAAGAIQEAAHDEGYDFDSSWLPWEEKPEPSYTHLAHEKQADQEKGNRENWVENERKRS